VLRGDSLKRYLSTHRGWSLDGCTGRSAESKAGYREWCEGSRYECVYCMKAITTTEASRRHIRQEHRREKEGKSTEELMGQSMVRPQSIRCGKCKRNVHQVPEDLNKHMQEKHSQKPLHYYLEAVCVEKEAVKIEVVRGEEQPHREGGRARHREEAGHDREGDPARGQGESRRGA